MARGYSEVQLREVGAGAKRILEAVLDRYDGRSADGTAHHVGKVRQVYDRSAYVEFRPAALDQSALLGPPLVLLAGHGFDGPLAAVLEGAIGRFQPSALAAGNPCRLRHASGHSDKPRYRLSLGGTLDVTLEPDRFSVLTPQAVHGPALVKYPQPTGDARASAVLETLRAADVTDGLGWLGDLVGFVSGESPNQELDAFVDGWVDRLSGAATGEPPPGTSLLGRGPGATPSGDDIVSGVLLALDRTVADRHRPRLRAAGEALVDVADARTTTVSTALLAQAVQGRAAGRVEAALRAVLGIEGEGTDWETAVLEAADVGHTSGVDLLVGMLLVPLALGPRLAKSR